MTLNKRDLKDDWNADELDEQGFSHCDWCGEAIHKWERFCPFTDHQAAYFEACEEDGDPKGHEEINNLYRKRGWA